MAIGQIATHLLAKLTELRGLSESLNQVCHVWRNFEPSCMSQNTVIS